MFSIKKIKISLLDKNGEPQYGLNWGQRTGREPNQAYIQLPIDVYRSDFFPKKPQRFKIYADGNAEFIFTRAQKTEEGTALQTPEDNSLFGKYLRARLGVAPGQKITATDILKYGCTEITFFKISSNTDILYYMDFSKGDPLPLPSTNSNEIQITFPRNRIIFGAPGTGKSHQLNDDAEKKFKNQALPLAQDGKPQNIDFIERVTFHPNYSYAHFVGTYKPVQDKDDPKQIRYEYVPGPFMRTLTKALNNPGSNFLLIIEEINRANVAAVFGDVFQLLDRDKNGTSEYPIATSEDIKKYLKKIFSKEDNETDNKSSTKDIDLEQIRIPSNMYIWATMNSADQGVFPMDAAFKRRWEFEYLGIDNNANKVQNYNIPVNNDRIIRWNDFRTKLNQMLIKETKVNEDKLLGPFFLSKNTLENALNDKENFIKLFKSKVLMYLFEDVVKMSPGKLFKDIGGRDLRYSEICKAFDEKGEGIFGFTLTNKADSQQEQQGQ